MGPLNAECFPAGLRFRERRDTVRAVPGHGATPRAQAETLLLQRETAHLSVEGEKCYERVM